MKGLCGRVVNICIRGIIQIPELVIQRFDYWVKNTEGREILVLCDESNGSEWELQIDNAKGERIDGVADMIDVILHMSSLDVQLYTA